MLAAVGKHAAALKYVSEEFGNDREIIMTAIKQDGNAILFIK